MRRATTISLLAALVTFATAPAFAGGGGGGQVCTPRVEGPEVILRDNCLEGVAHTLPAGENLRVRNHGRVAHNYVAVDGAFDSGLLQPGEETTLAVPAGIHDVYCTLHGTADGQGMAGTLIVTDPGEAIAGEAMAAGSAPAPDRAAHPASWWALGLAGLALAGSGLALRKALTSS